MGNKVKQGDNVLSILPMAHMYGMAFEFIYEFLRGCHVYYLTRVPSPAIIAKAFAEIHPAIIIAVPLVIEKIIKKKVFPKIQNNRMRLLLNMPVISKKVRQTIRDQVVNSFGGNFMEVIISNSHTRWVTAPRSAPPSSAMPTILSLSPAVAARWPSTMSYASTAATRRTSQAKSSCVVST